MEDQKERYTTYLLVSLKEKIVDLSIETRIPQAGLFEEAVTDLLKNYGKLDEQK